MESDPEIVLPRGETAGLWARAADRTATVALVFCGVVLALLLFNASQIKSANPLNHAGLAALVEQLHAADKARDAAEVSRLTAGIRELDAAARSQFFRAREAARRGWWLLVIGAAVYLLSSKAAGVLRRAAPMPPASPEPPAPPAGVPVRAAVIAVMTAVALALLIASFAVPERQSPAPAGQQSQE